MSPDVAILSPMNESAKELEVLDPPMSKGDARAVELRARRRFKAVSRNLMLFAADLRRLQDGQVHITRGFDSFGDYAVVEFDGLSRASAKQLSRQGKALLVLEANGRLDLDDGKGTGLPGTTGLRALSAVLGNHDEQTMLAVWDKAVTLRPGRAVVDHDVTSATTQLIAPATSDLTLPEPDWPEEPELPDEDTEEVHEVNDELANVRDALNRVSAAVSEHGVGDAARHAYHDLIEEARLLGEQLSVENVREPL